MDIFYWKGPQGNFGDDLNEWLWDELLPGYRDYQIDTTLIGVGSILDIASRKVNGNAVVIGAGGYSNSISNRINNQWDIQSVRGPRTAAALNIPKEKGIIDPAAIIPVINKIKRMHNYNVVFVPHWTSEVLHKDIYKRVCVNLGITYVSPCDDSIEVIEKISSTNLVIAQSMHAAIIADSFRVPWHCVTTASVDFSRKKWLDWAESLEIKLSFNTLSCFEAPALFARKIERRLTGTLDENKSSIRLKENFLLKAFLYLMGKKGQLSDPYVLKKKQDKLFYVLDGVMSCYLK